LFPEIIPFIHYDSFFVAGMMICFQIDLTFVDKNLPNESGFTLTLSMQTTFAEMATDVAKHLNTDPANLQVQSLLLSTVDICCMNFI
jgi:hypothetical protein